MSKKKEISESREDHLQRTPPKRIQTAEGWKRSQLKKRKSSKSETKS